jgi:cell wall-associated NlpC family hydrolase
MTTPPGPQVRDLPQILQGKGAKQKIGDAPLIPVTMILIGSYLAWFGVHYWRDKTTIWPTDPVKDILQGKGLPAKDPEQTAAEDITGAAAQAASQAVIGTAGAGTTSGDAIAQDIEQYVGRVKYVWGGASPATGWDCSGAVNYVLCHDLLLDIPGYRAGTFSGAQHGPNVASWLASNLVQIISGSPQPGDLIAWGPNEHMGIAISATDMVSAEDPAQGTGQSPIAGFFATAPVILRLKATVQLSGGDSATNQNIARLLTAGYGWSPSQDPGQWDALDKLWTRESRWSVTATNQTSGAYGIAQALPGSKMASIAANWKTSAQTQIAWGLSYIKARYGTPEAAWEHEQAHGWY